MSHICPYLELSISRQPQAKAVQKTARIYSTIYTGCSYYFLFLIKITAVFGILQIRCIYPRRFQKNSSLCFSVLRVCYFSCRQYGLVSHLIWILGNNSVFPSILHCLLLLCGCIHTDHHRQLFLCLIQSKV